MPQLPEYYHKIGINSLPFPLPSKWNPQDKSSLLQLDSNNQGITYHGPGKNDSDAAAVRSDVPVLPGHGIFYWEISVRDRGRDGFIGIGFCQQQSMSLARLPGWEANSWAYHGDDGHCFEGTGTGRVFGPVFGTGDTVGCGINFINGQVFFTKNGIMLGCPFKPIHGLAINTQAKATNGQITSNQSAAPSGNQLALYPTIGMRTPGESIVTNFGDQPFLFDINSYVLWEKQKVLDCILRGDVKQVASIDCNDLMEKRLVMDYLISTGRFETARAFYKDAFENSSYNGYFNNSSTDDDGNVVKTTEMVISTTSNRTRNTTGNSNGPSSSSSSSSSNALNHNSCLKVPDRLLKECNKLWLHKSELNDKIAAVQERLTIVSAIRKGSPCIEGIEMR